MGRKESHAHRGRKRLAHRARHGQWAPSAISMVVAPHCGANSLSGAYVGVAPVEDDGVDFHARMKEIHEELKALQARSNELMATISKNMEVMGL